MTSTLKANCARATIYMAFPQRDSTHQQKSQHTPNTDQGLGGLLEGMGPTLSELSLLGLLRSLKQ